MDELKDIFERFDKRWALLTAGPLERHNSMTISWGELGTLWGHKVATVYVKPARYTYSFMEANDYFVLSFFPEEYRAALGVMGSKSGRDIDKDAAAKLTPIQHGEVTVYQEASLTIVCKKIYWNDLDPAHIPDAEMQRYYTAQAPHRMYVGEVVEILQ